jgi:hypothetical protein
VFQNKIYFGASEMVLLLNRDVSVLVSCTCFKKICVFLCRYGEGQLKVMYVGGPNTRKDFHIEEGEEVRKICIYI